MGGEIKVADGIKVANQLTLRREDHCGYQVGSNIVTRYLQMKKGGRTIGLEGR
jgi:hypothetical protein